MVQLVRSIVDAVIDLSTFAMVTIACLIAPRYRRMGEVRAAYELGKEQGRRTRS